MNIEMKKNKMCYLLLVAFVAYLFITIDVTNAAAVNQTSIQQSRERINLNTSSNAKNLTEEDSLKMKDKALNLTNIEKTNDHREPNTHKFSPNGEKKHLENLFKLSKQDRNIENNANFDRNEETFYPKSKRHLDDERSTTKNKKKCKKRNCMPSYYPVLCVQQLHCSDEVDAPLLLNLENSGEHSEDGSFEEESSEEESSEEESPEDEISEIELHLPNPMTDYPHFNQPVNPPNYPYNNYNAPSKFNIYPKDVLNIHTKNCRNSPISCLTEEAEDQNIRKSQEFKETLEQEHVESLNTALQMTNNFAQQTSQVKSEFQQHSFSQKQEIHSFQEFSIEEQKILKETINSVLSTYNSFLKHKHNLQNIVDDSYIQRTLTNAIKTEFLNNLKETSITDEIIKTYLVDIIKHLLKTSVPEVENEPMYKGTLIPLAEVRFKIGQWIKDHRNPNQQMNEEIYNKMNIETQVIPVIQNLEPIFSVEVKNAPVYSSDSDVIRNLPTTYTNAETLPAIYKMRNENQNFPKNEQSSLPNMPTGKDLFVNSEQKFTENKQRSETSHNKESSKSEDNFYRSDNDGRNGNSQVYSGSSIREQNAESDNFSNTASNREFSNNTQIRASLRRKKDLVPSTKLEEALEKSFNTNPGTNFDRNLARSFSKNPRRNIDKNFENNFYKNTGKNHDNTESNFYRNTEKNFDDTERNFDKNIEKKYDTNTKKNYDTNTERNFNRNFERISNQNLGKYLDKNLDRNLDKNLEKNHDQNLGSNLDKNLGRNHDKNWQKNLHENPERNIYKDARIVGLLANDLLNQKMQEDPYVEENSRFSGSMKRGANLANGEHLQKRIDIKKIRPNENVSKLQIPKVLNVPKSSATQSNQYFKPNNFNNRKNSKVLGRLLPQNKENTEFIYVGNVMKLPIKLKKLKDGSFSVNLSKNIRHLSHGNSDNQATQKLLGNNKKEERRLKKDSSTLTADKLKRTWNGGLRDSSASLKNHRMKREKPEEHEQYKNYLETLLEVNDIPKNERLIVITDALEKKRNNETSDFEIKKDGVKKNFLIEKIKFNTKERMVKKINCNEDKTCEISKEIDFLTAFLGWIRNIILSPFNALNH